jgi:hypothetical protein
MSRVSPYAETVQSGAIALEGDLAAFQYLKRQCWRRVVEDDDVEAIGGHVSGKGFDRSLQPRASIAASGAVDQNRDVDVTIRTRSPGRLRSEEESRLNFGQRFRGVGDGAQ